MPCRPITLTHSTSTSSWAAVSKSLCACPSLRVGVPFHQSVRVLWGISYCVAVFQMERLGFLLGLVPDATRAARASSICCTWVSFVKSWTNLGAGGSEGSEDIVWEGLTRWFEGRTGTCSLCLQLTHNSCNVFMLSSWGMERGKIIIITAERCVVVNKNAGILTALGAPNCIKSDSISFQRYGIWMDLTSWPPVLSSTTPFSQNLFETCMVCNHVISVERGLVACKKIRKNQAGARNKSDDALFWHPKWN